MRKKVEVISYNKWMNYSHGNAALEQAMANSYQKTDPTRFCYTVPQAWKLDGDFDESNINYVIATWSGERRAGNTKLLANPILYLQQQIETLKRLNHEINQITVMVPDNPIEPVEFTNFVSELSALKNLVIMRRPNEGQSYGSYVDCYKHFRDQFDYYIFVEDDYLPTQNNFDQLLLQMFKASQNCGYLCSRVDKYPPTNYMGRPHAAISNGITSSAVLATIMEKLGDIPCGRKSTEQHAYAATPQLEFSWSFLDAGWWLYDYSSHYCSPYQHVGEIQHYGSIHKPAFFVPIQIG